MALFNDQLKVVKAMDRYFKRYKEEFLAEKHDTYKDLGETQLSLEAYAEQLKAESKISITADR
jgi:hypothetical protein